MKKLIFLLILLPAFAFAQHDDPLKQLKDFDQYMQQCLKDWNTPGACVGIVVKDIGETSLLEFERHLDLITRLEDRPA